MALKYLLDTNALCNPSKPKPDPGVLRRWRENRDVIATASICWYEMWYGVSILPQGKRRKMAEGYIDELKTLILPFTDKAARWLGEEQARLEQKGLAVGLADGQIAAVAKVNGLIVVTDNVKDFKHLDVPVENWMEQR